MAPEGTLASGSAPDGLSAARHARRGEDSYQQRDYEGAVGDFTAVLRLSGRDSERLEAFSRRALAYEAMERLPLALRDAEEALRLASEQRVREQMLSLRGRVHKQLAALRSLESQEDVSLASTRRAQVFRLCLDVEEWPRCWRLGEWVRVRVYIANEFGPLNGELWRKLDWPQGLLRMPVVCSVSSLAGATFSSSVIDVEAIAAGEDEEAAAVGRGEAASIGAEGSQGLLVRLLGQAVGEQDVAADGPWPAPLLLRFALGDVPPAARDAAGEAEASPPRMVLPALSPPFLLEHLREPAPQLDAAAAAPRAWDADLWAEAGVEACREVRCPGLPRPLLLAEAPERLGLAGKVWDSAILLIAQLAADSAEDAPGPFSVRGRRVLELGAGTGAVGLACACLGAEEVVITDLAAQLPLLRLNAALLAAQAAAAGSQHLPPVRAAALPWGTAKPAGEQPRGFGAIVLSDVVYDAALHEPLLATLRAVTDGDAPAPVLLAQRRRFVEDGRFFELAAESFSAQRVEPCGRALAELGAACRNVELYCLRRQG